MSHTTTIIRVVGDDQLAADWAVVTHPALGKIVFVARHAAPTPEALDAISRLVIPAQRDQSHDSAAPTASTGLASTA